MEVWRKMKSNPEKYFKPSDIAVLMAMTMEGSHVVFSDHTNLVRLARRTGLCNWGILDDRYLSLGFGAAFVRRSPYKMYIDEM